MAIDVRLTPYLEAIAIRISICIMISMMFITLWVIIKNRCWPYSTCNQRFFWHKRAGRGMLRFAQIITAHECRQKSNAVITEQPKRCLFLLKSYSYNKHELK